MFGQSFNSPYIMPNMYNIPSVNYLPRGASRGISSLFGKNAMPSTSHGLSSLIRNINFPNMLNNASRALGIVKEAIPIVKEVKPMIGNMRSMLKIASVFKDETDTTNNKNTNTSTKENSTNIKNDIVKEKDINISNNQPNFFL